MRAKGSLLRCLIPLSPLEVTYAQNSDSTRGRRGAHVRRRGCATTSRRAARTLVRRIRPWCYGDGGVAAGIIGGLAAGAIIGGIAANQGYYYGPGYYDEPVYYGSPGYYGPGTYYGPGPYAYEPAPVYIRPAPRYRGGGFGSKPTAPAALAITAPAAELMHARDPEKWEPVFG